MPPLHIHKTEIIPGMEVVRVILEHFRKVFRSSVQILDLITQQRAVEQCRRVIRLKLKSVIIIRHRAEIIIKIISQIGAVHIEVSLLRLKPYRRIHIGKRGFPLFLLSLYLRAHQESVDQIF